MIPVTRDFTIYQGSEFEVDIDYQEEGVDFDLSGYTAQLQIRLKDSSTSTIYDTDDDVDSITISGNTVSIRIPAASTAAFTFRRAHYDLEITSDANKTYRILQGVMTLNKEITR